VFFCSQRTAYLHSLNLGPTPTTIVYFKISHLDHAVLKNTSLESLWVEYKAAAYYVESANEEAAEATQRVIEERASRQRALQQKVEQQQQKVRFLLLVNMRNGCLMGRCVGMYGVCRKRTRSVLRSRWPCRSPTTRVRENSGYTALHSRTCRYGIPLQRAAQQAHLGHLLWLRE
jgi:aromatic ring hydroxylase